MGGDLAEIQSSAATSIRKKRNFQTFTLLSNVNHSLGRCGLCGNAGIKEWRRCIIEENSMFVFWFTVDVPSIVSSEELVPLQVIKEDAMLGYIRINMLCLTENMLYCFFWVVWILCVDVSEHCQFHLHMWCKQEEFFVFAPHMKMEQTECYEMSTRKIQTRRNNTKKE